MFGFFTGHVYNEIQKRHQLSMLQLSSHRREWTHWTQQCSDQMKISFKSEAKSWQNHCKPIRCCVSPMISGFEVGFLLNDVCLFGVKSFTVSPAAKTWRQPYMRWKENEIMKAPRIQALGKLLDLPNFNCWKSTRNFHGAIKSPSQPNLTWGSGEFGSFRLVFLAWKDGTPRGTKRAWWACELENIYNPMTVWSICLFWEMCRKYRCILLYTFASSISWANCGLKNSWHTPILLVCSCLTLRFVPSKKDPFFEMILGCPRKLVNG